MVTLNTCALLVTLVAGSTAWHRSPDRGNIYEEGRLRRESNSFVPKTPDVTFNITFLEDIPEYPMKMLMEILKKEGEKHKDSFGKETIFKDFMISRRLQPGTETTLCPSMPNLVYPKVALNKDNKWKFIVNVGEEYIQGVRVETCGHFNECSLSNSFPSGYTTMCQQKYVFRRLLSVSDKGHTLVDEFRMPSCCSCSVIGPDKRR